MSFKFISRVAGVLALTVGLAGCIDVDAELEVTSETTARTVTVMEISADSAKAIDGIMTTMAEQMGVSPEEMKEGMGDTSFSLEDNCDEGVGSAAPDGSSKCVITKQGTFAEISTDEDGPKFEALGNGTVKVTLPINELKKAGEGSGAEGMPDEPEFTKLFEGHFITFRIKGREIVESNMEVSGDKTTAQFKVPSIELLGGKLELTEDLYAIVRVN